MVLHDALDHIIYDRYPAIVGSVRPLYAWLSAVATESLRYDKIDYFYSIEIAL